MRDVGISIYRYESRPVSISPRLARGGTGIWYIHYYDEDAEYFVHCHEIRYLRPLWRKVLGEYWSRKGWDREPVRLA